MEDNEKLAGFAGCDTVPVGNMVLPCVCGSTTISAVTRYEPNIKDFAVACTCMTCGRQGPFHSPDASRLFSRMLERAKRSWDDEKRQPKTLTVKVPTVVARVSPEAQALMEGRLYPLDDERANGCFSAEVAAQEQRGTYTATVNFGRMLSGEEQERFMEHVMGWRP